MSCATKLETKFHADPSVLWLSQIIFQFSKKVFVSLSEFKYHSSHLKMIQKRHFNNETCEACMNGKIAPAHSSSCHF